MGKEEMILWLRQECKSWEGVYVKFKRPKNSNRIRAINGWWLSFDGPSLDDMYLTNKHPLGDESGLMINIGDYND